MRVERETAGFALPFTAGVLLAAYSGISLSGMDTTSPAAALAVTAICLFTLIHPSRKTFRTSTLCILTGTVAFSSGMLCAFTSSHISVSLSDGDFIIWAESLGRRMQDAIDRIPFTDKNANAIAKALITGERSDIPEWITEAFRNSGASHILALSGLHLGIVYAIMNQALSLAGNYRKIWIPRSLAIILLCGLYTAATGAGPSTARAFLFIFLRETARLTHRHHSTGQILFSALIIQLVLSPSSIRNVGFQLSYAAMAGIAFILPPLQSLWPGSIYEDRPMIKAARKVWNAAAMSVACQLTTAPLAWHYFGTFPKHFLITNLISLPLTGIIIPAIIITLCLQTLGICPAFIISITEQLITALIRSLEIISSM